MPWLAVTLLSHKRRNRETVENHGTQFYTDAGPGAPNRVCAPATGKPLGVSHTRREGAEAGSRSWSREWAARSRAPAPPSAAPGSRCRVLTAGTVAPAFRTATAPGFREEQTNFELGTFLVNGLISLALALDYELKPCTVFPPPNLPRCWREPSRAPERGAEAAEASRGGRRPPGRSSRSPRPAARESVPPEVEGARGARSMQSLNITPEQFSRLLRDHNLTRQQFISLYGLRPLVYTPELPARAKLAFVLTGVLIFALALFGNALVVYVVTRSKAMRTVTNIFICSLALSDLLIAFFCIPVTMLQNISDNWLGGEFAPFPSPLIPSLPPNATHTLRFWLSYFVFSLPNESSALSQNFLTCSHLEISFCCFCFRSTVFLSVA